jgi:hypothetical protein
LELAHGGRIPNLDKTVLSTRVKFSFSKPNGSYHACAVCLDRVRAAVSAPHVDVAICTTSEALTLIAPCSARKASHFETTENAFIASKAIGVPELDVFRTGGYKISAAWLLVESDTKYLICVALLGAKSSP